MHAHHLCAVHIVFYYNVVYQAISYLPSNMSNVTVLAQGRRPMLNTADQSKSKKEGKDQESIQLSTTPDPEYP